MIFRVCALWNRDRRVFIGALSVFALHITLYISMLAYSYAKGIVFPQILPFTGCAIIPGYDKAWTAFTVSLAFEIMIISLNLCKSWSVAVKSGIRAPLMRLLLGDGMAYFAIIIAAQVLTLVCLNVPSVLTAPIVGAYPSIAIAGVACNRLFTRLQRLLLADGRDQSTLSIRDIWSSNTFGGGSYPANIRFPKHRRPYLESRSTGYDELGHVEVELSQEGDPGSHPMTTMAQRHHGVPIQDSHLSRMRRPESGIEVLLNASSYASKGPTNSGPSASVEWENTSARMSVYLLPTIIGNVSVLYSIRFNIYVLNSCSDE